MPSRPTQRGVGRRHDEGRGAVDAEMPVAKRHGRVRQRRVVLTPQCWRRRWQQYMAHRGERVISRKAIAQGMSDVLRCPVCSCAHFLCTLRMRSRVQRASGIPCALWIWRGREVFLQTSGAMRRENADTHPVSSPGLTGRSGNHRTLGRTKSRQHRLHRGYWIARSRRAMTP